MSGRFAISVPVGGWSDLLPQCLASLRAQQAPLAVAFLDASNDPRVAAEADKYAGMFAYRRCGPDAGQSDAILEGWANVEGDILGWLNADDILMPGALSAATARFGADPALDVVYGHSTIVDDGGAMTGYHFSVEPPGPSLYESGIVSQPSCFFKRAAYDCAGGLNRDLHYTMDWDLWIRMMKAGSRFGFIDAPLSMVRWSDDTKTASFNEARRAELKAIIEEYAPPEKQARIFRSFAIHSLTDRIEPPALKKSVLRYIRRRAHAVFGIGANGRIDSGARLFLAHYEDAAKTGLQLEIDGDPRTLALSQNGAALEASARKGVLDIALYTPVNAGQMLVIDLAVRDGATLYLKRCAWR